MPRKKSPAAAEPTEEAIASILRVSPKQWTECNFAKLTASNKRALSLLINAGLIDRRFKCRIQVVGNSVAVAVTFTATGDGGIEKQLASVVMGVEEWGEIKHRKFQIKETAPVQWRISKQGAIALEDLNTKENRATAMDFILRRNFKSDRPKVQSGTIEEISKVMAGDISHGITMAEITSAFAKAMELVKPSAKSEMVPLSENEQAVFDTLSEKPMLGKEIARKLNSKLSIDESQISVICKLPQMQSRGVRNRPRVGYYIEKNSTNRAQL